MFAPSSRGEQGRYYLGVGGGLNLHSNIDIFSSEGSILLKNIQTGASYSTSRVDDASFDLGFSGSAYYGYAYKNWRFELEGSLRYFGLDKIGTIPNLANDVNWNGYQMYLSVLGNIYYDYLLINKFYLTVGGGLGYTRAQVKIKDAVIDTNTSTVVSFNDGSNNVSFQFMIGPTYQYSEDWFFSLEYKLFAVYKPSVSIFDKKFKYQMPIIHTVELSVRRLL